MLAGIVRISEYMLLVVYLLFKISFFYISFCYCRGTVVLIP